MSNRQQRFDEALAEIKNGPRISHPVISAIQFANLTNTEGGASMNVHTNKIAEPGDDTYFVGGAPARAGGRVPTAYHGKTEIDASTAYRNLPTAMASMKSRNEKALWDMKNMDEVRNPDFVDDGRPAATPPDRSGSSDLSPLDVLRHSARLQRVSRRDPGLTLGTWRDNG